jgi:hypothetical protein
LLISGGVLVYQYVNHNPNNEKLEKEIEQYELQKKHLISIDFLTKNPAIQAFFTDLLQNCAQKFADNQNLNISHRSLVFGGFYCEKNNKEIGEMGRCLSYELIYPQHNKTITISLNRLYLLNKLGHDRYFATHPNQESYFYLDISFSKMLKTCSHELAHYFQHIKHGKSSCKSDLKLNNGKYNAELTKEHKEIRKEIYGMIKNSPEYLELERK